MVNVSQVNGATIKVKNGDAEITDGSKVEEGTALTLSYTLTDGYTFEYFTLNGNKVTGNTVVITENSTISANVTLNQHTVTITNPTGITLTAKNGNTTIASGSKVAYGTVLTLSNSLTTGYSFNNYTLNGNKVTGTAVTITSDATISASVIHDEYTLTIVSSEGGTITVSKTKAYYGDTITLTNTPSANYTFTSYTVNGSAISGSSFTMPAKHTTVSATFKYAGLYTAVSGSVSDDKTNATTGASNTIALKKSATFSSGTLSVSMKLAGQNNCDNGIVFSVTNPNNLSTFWEANVSYYFFFLSKDNTAYLGKVANGSWIVCGLSAITIDWSKSYTLSVSVQKNSSEDIIRCYVNNVLYVSYSDTNKLSGTQFGIRTGEKNIVYSAFETSTAIKGQNDSLSDFTTRNGSFASATNGLKSSAANSIAQRNNAQFKYGTLSVRVNMGGNASDCGLVFGLSSTASSFWEGAGTSYYFLFISSSGALCLGRTANGVWSSSGWEQISGFSASAGYTIKVVRDDTTVYAYVNNVLRITFADASPLTGTGYGVRAGSSGVTFDNFLNISSEWLNVTVPSDVTVKQGSFTGVNGSIKASQANSIATIKDVTNGTLSVNVTGVTNGDSGVVFGYTDNSNYYKFYTHRVNQTVQLALVQNGTTTVLYSNYLSAGYYESGSFTFKVVIVNNKAYCYFFNTLYTTVNIALAGRAVGMYSANPGTFFNNYSVSSDNTVTTCDTLLFGHSYFELWDDWRDDFAYVQSNVSGFGTYTNIGIGGSVASQWLNFKDALLCYNFKKAIYMIGINDLSAGVSPSATVGYVSELLLYLKQQIPDLTVVLVGIAQCNARHTDYANFGGVDVHTQVTETNALYRQFTAQYDWINYAETENLFCDSNGNPQTKWFKDGLHPTSGTNHGSSTDGYRELLIPAIISAWNGENQPTITEEEKSALLLNAKNIKISSLSNYSSYAYRASERATSQPIYDEAVSKINACATVDAVNALDLSSYITRLKAIKNNAQYMMEEMLALTYTNDGSNFSDYLWETNVATNSIKTSSGTTYNMSDYGHRLNSAVTYSDVSFTFKMSEISGVVATGGVMFRAKQTSTRGIDGYYVNLVSDANYVQIWYFNNAYNAGGTPTLTYLGGWVYPGSVINTTFRVIVRGSICYVYEEETYLSQGEDAYGCYADLSNNGQYAVYEEGYLGVLGWNNVSFKLNLSDVVGNGVSYYATQVVNGITSNSNVYANATNITDNCGRLNTKNGCFSLYNANATDFKMEISVTGVSSTGLPFVEANNTQAGFLFRAKKNASSGGIDGYFINFVADTNRQYVQLWYLKNGFNYSGDGAQEIYTYIGGWIFSETSSDTVVGNTFIVNVTDSTIKIRTMQREGVELTLAGNSQGFNYNYDVYSNGGFGIVTYHSLNLAFNSITLKK